MSLIVGCATPDIGFLIGDTLLSYEIEMKGRTELVSGDDHALKIHILNGQTAVAFAGKPGGVEIAVRLITDLHVELKSNSQAANASEKLFALYSRLQIEASVQPPPDCEFLVLELTLKGKKLARVTDKGIFYCQRAYIGDQAEYSVLKGFQDERPYCPPAVQQVQQTDGTFCIIPLTLSEGEIEFTEVSDAMERLTHRRQSTLVGAIAGCITRVVDARISGELEYLQSSEASLTPWEGDSGFSFLASSSDTRGIGIYYRSGRMGFLFVSGDGYGHKEYAGTVAEFIKVATTKYGLNLT